jgi:hypothetical protein
MNRNVYKIILVQRCWTIIAIDECVGYTEFPYTPAVIFMDNWKYSKVVVTSAGVGIQRWCMFSFETVERF